MIEVLHRVVSVKNRTKRGPNHYASDVPGKTLCGRATDAKIWETVSGKVECKKCKLFSLSNK
jgi:hypothetical protein